VQKLKDSIANTLKDYGERAKAASTNSVDYKACYHSLRVINELKQLHTLGRIVYPSPDREYLLSIRQGTKTFEELSEEIDTRLDEVLALEKTSVLAEIVSEEYMDDFIRYFYS
jgi:hypothetical protein